MKNSAWYTKLWRNKLDKLPIKTDTDTAWNNMQQLLDQQMPVHHSFNAGHAAKPFMAKLPALLMYILPLAVVISVAVYFGLKKDKPVVIKKAKKQTEILRDSLQESSATDSVDVEKLATDTNKTQTQLPANNLNATDESHPVSQAAPVKSITSLLGASVSGNIVAGKNSSGKNSGVYLSGKDTGNPKLDSAKTETQKPVVTGSEKTSDNIMARLTTDSANILKVEGASAKKAKPKNSLTNSKSKDKNVKPAKASRLKLKNSNDTDEPDFTYGIKIGLNRGSTKNISFGVFSSYKITPKWFIDAEVLANTGKTVTGNFTHESYFRPDSIAAFSVSSSRKLYQLDIPINIRYKISNMLSIKAGPVISIPLKQSTQDNRITNLLDVRDTLYNTKTIMNALAKTSVTPKINIGLSAGIDITVSRFIIEGRYMQNAPSTITSGLGSYKAKSQYFQISLGYKLNKRRKH